MRRPVAVLGLALLLAGCDSQGAGSECPDCDCDCEGEQADAPPASSGGGTSAQPPSTKTADGKSLTALMASANRNMNHERGKECLEDLDAIEKLDPDMKVHTAVQRGQCEMLVGKCQAGKKRVAKWYVDEAAFSAERADELAEVLGGMRCRGGDSTDRDELMRALNELQDGAYLTRRSGPWCKERIDTVRDLMDKVPVQGDDDKIKGGLQALFYTGSACHAKADDCAGAEKVYKEFFPKEGLKALPDDQKKEVVRKAFRDSFQACH